MTAPGGPEKWNYAPSMESGFWSIVSQSGHVIALRVTSEKYARDICFEHSQYLHTLEVLKNHMETSLKKVKR